jgi:hypothetical protein
MKGSCDLGDFREIIIGNHWYFRKSLEAFSVRKNDLISEKALSPA